MRECSHCGLANQAESRFCARCGANLHVVIDEARAAYNTPVAPGTIFEGKYQVLEEIGRGGMGVVYRGHDLSLDRLVAIKVLPEQFNTDDEVIQRFKKEARAMATLDHPNVVPVYAIGQFRNFHYFVMKFLEGKTVADILEEMRRDGRERFEPRDVQRVVIDVCRGLSHAHGKGLIHRDIKPGNIMVGGDLAVTIMDFGIVKEEKGGENLTRTGLVFGTPEYMAPEQAQGHALPGPTTDIYSLGVVAYEMLSGAPPFRGDTPFSVVIKHIKEPPEPLVERVPGVSRAFQEIVFRALEKKTERRYASAEQMREAMASIDPDLLEVDEGDPSFVLEEVSPRAPHLPPPAPLPMGMPAPPLRPSVGPPPVAEVRGLPPPGHIPGRARAVPSEPSGVAIRRPAVPVTVNRPPGAPPTGPSDPALVEDRPGHYRSLTTARSLRDRERSRVPNWLPAALVGALALLGILFILFAMGRRGDTNPGVEGDAADVDTPIAGRAAPDGPTSVTPSSAPPTVAPTRAVAPDTVMIGVESQPDRVEVYGADGVAFLATTPYWFRRPRNAAAETLTLRKPGYRDEKLTVIFVSDSKFTVKLEPQGKP
ncbi:MAG: protein kinase domain-containing protein [Bradymonadia bacterium]